MTDFFEIDFLDVETTKSGDAIPLRYRVNGVAAIHVVDGGFQETGTKVVKHIRTYYGNPSFIDRVVATHPDGDHAGGLRTVLEEFNVGELWMLRPWIYAAELIDQFPRFNSVQNLIKRLKEIYPNLAALEEIALAKGITILEPFQGASLGPFVVMSPTKSRYLDLVVESERTPESATASAAGILGKLGSSISEAGSAVVSFLKAAWGQEVFSLNGTSAENDMSVVQYVNLCGKKILLTGDAGRRALSDVMDFAPQVGLSLPGIDRFQVPHHGSRRNVSTEILDRLLGPRLPSGPAEERDNFHAMISSAKADKDHPRKAVVRACIHRGGRVFSTEGKSLRSSQNAPDRGWNPAVALPYPEDQEE